MSLQGAAEGGGRGLAAPSMLRAPGTDPGANAKRENREAKGKPLYKCQRCQPARERAPRPLLFHAADKRERKEREASVAAIWVRLLASPRFCKDPPLDLLVGEKRSVAKDDRRRNVGWGARLLCRLFASGSPIREAAQNRPFIHSLAPRCCFVFCLRWNFLIVEKETESGTHSG